jgi:hypothetical protein
MSSIALILTNVLSQSITLIRGAFIEMNNYLFHKPKNNYNFTFFDYNSIKLKGFR